jgi:hypothetical protein
MVYNKNKDEDEHYDIKEHYDNPYENVDAKNVQWIPIIIGILLLLFLLVAIFSGGGKWIYKKIFGETKVPDNKELTTDKSVKVSADLVFSKDVPHNATQTTSTTVKPPLGVSHTDARGINYSSPQIYKMGTKSFMV